MAAASVQDTQSVAPERSDREAQPDRPRKRILLARLITFAIAFALVVLFALRNGSYDLVVRQESGLIIWWVLAIGLALGLLPRGRVPRPTLLLLVAMGAYASWVALSLTWTESSERTFAELARVLDYIGLVALVACVLDRQTWRSAVMGLGFGALFVCTLSLASRLAPSGFPFDQASHVFRADRLDFPFGYWNTVGAWGAMSAAFGLIWSAHDTSSVRRALALALVPVACVTTYLTYSRAGVGAMALAVLIALALSRNRITAFIHTAVAAAGAALAILAVRSAPQVARATGTRGASTVLGAVLFGGALCIGVVLLTQRGKVDRRRVPRTVARNLGAVAAVGLLAVGGALGPHVLSKAWHSFKKTKDTHSANPTARLTNLSGTRYNLWDVAIKGFKAHPASGTGPGTYEFWWNRHQKDSEFVRNAHSLWFENMSELGTPGLLLIISVVVAALLLAARARRRSRRSPTVGATAAVTAMFLVYLLSASVDWMWQSTAISALALAAVACTSARLSNGRLHLRAPRRAAAVLPCLLAAALQVPGLLSTTEIRRSQAAARAGDPARALAWAQNAVSEEPWSASAYLQRGLVYEARGQLAKAALDVENAISHERTNFATWLILARIQTERGRYAAALREYVHAYYLRPQGQVFQFVQLVPGV